MTKTADLIERVSKNLGVPWDELIRDSIRAYLNEKLRDAVAEMHEIKLKYDVKDSKDFKKKIDSGQIEDQSALEEMITLEDLEEKARKIKAEIE